MPLVDRLLTHFEAATSELQLPLSVSKEFMLLYLLCDDY